MLNRAMRGNTAQNNARTLSPGRVTADSEIPALRLHDGVTPGGFEIAVTKSVNTGPGSQSVVAGSGDKTFLGEVSANNFINTNELSTEAGVSSGNVIHASSPWLKFQLQGKVLFVAKRALRGGLSFNQLNNSGVVSFGDTNIVIDGLTFSVRLLSGSEFNPYDGDRGNGGEWDALLYPIHVDDPNNENWGINYTNDDLAVGYGHPSSTWCREVTTNAVEFSGYPSALQRGGDSIADGEVARRDWTNDHRVRRPVLELVQ